MSSQMRLSSELVAAVDTLKLPHAFMATQMDTELLPRFEGFATYVTAVRTAFLVLAGLVTDEGPFLCEALLTHITAEGTLAGVCPVVFIQTGLRPEGFPTEVTLVRPLPTVNPQMHVEVVLLGERVATEGTYKRTLISVNGFDMHLQAVSTRRTMAALLTHKWLFTSMFGSFMHTQLRPSQEGFGALGTCVWFGITVDLHHVKCQVFLVHKLLRTRRTLVGHISCVGDNMQT